MTQMYYGAPDLYVHTDWIKQMLGGKFFSSGVYPFGMHNMIAAHSRIFGINVITCMRLYGVLFSFFIVLSVYLLMQKMFQSRNAVNIGFLIFSVSNIVTQRVWWRQAFSLPQEAGIIFLLPCGIFLFEYIKTKEIKHLAFFSMALFMMVSMHFYVAIAVMFMLGAIFIVNITDIIKSKIFLKIVFAGLISLALTVGTLVVPNLLGVRWEGSMGWALRVLSSAGDQSESVTEPLESMESENPDEIDQRPFKEKLADAVQKSSEELSLDIHVYLIFIAGTIVMTLYSLVIIMFFAKKRYYGKFLLAMALYSIFFFMLSIGYELGFPEIIEKPRLAEFFGNNYGFMIAIFIEIFMIPFLTVKFFRKIRPVMFVLIFAAFGYYVFMTGFQLNSRMRVFQYQYNSTIQSYYKIVNRFPKNKFTIVSSVDELCMVRGLGWHYELSDLIYELAENDSDGKINMPTDDVLIFIEKRPIRPGRLNDPVTGFEFSSERPVSVADAKKDTLVMKDSLKDEWNLAYTVYENRRIIMSKAYYWMQEYKNYFKQEIYTFYEDDDIIVYHLRQLDPYVLNNLYIDYKYN